MSAGAALDLVLRAGIVWMSVLVTALVLGAARARGRLERILALDTLAIAAVGLLALLGYLRRAGAYLDAGLALSLLAFAGTLAAVRHDRETDVTGGAEE